MCFWWVIKKINCRIKFGISRNCAKVQEPGYSIWWCNKIYIFCKCNFTFATILIKLRIIHQYIQIILELYINTCQRIRFESMSSRKIMQYHSLSRCWLKRMQILSVTAAINIYVVVVWPIWAWNLIRKHGFPSIAKCMVTKIKDIS